MKYKVIFFDADGVILKGGYTFTEKLQKQHSLKMENMLPFFQGPFQACAEGKADVKEELAKVIETWKWIGTVDELIHFWLTEGTIFDQETIRLAELLKKAGTHCFVSTGQEKYRGEFIKEKVGNGNPFEDVYYSAEVGCSKNEPLFLETIFDRVKHITTDKSKILLIDDSEHIITSATDFGFDTLFCKTTTDLEILKKYA